MFGGDSNIIFRDKETRDRANDVGTETILVI